ncbi:MAG: hypothetical protein V4671_21360 [Armatimonadota bacterium]
MVTQNTFLSRIRSAHVVPAVLVLGTLACLTPASSADAAAPSVPQNPMALYYLRPLGHAADPRQPLRLLTTTSRTGTTLYEFRDKRTGKTFRDGASILSDFTRLARAGKTRHLGASAYAVPAEFRGTATGTEKPIYLAAVQRKHAENLRAELRSWRSLLAASPRILSPDDLAPETVAAVDQRTKKITLRLTLTEAGAKKLGDFTAKHRKEVVAFVLDPGKPGSRVLLAPTIESPITSPELRISGGFETLAEAQKLATRINDYAQVNKRR